MMKYPSFTKALPVLFGFLIVGFVDLVGVANSYVKKDFALNDTLANILPRVSLEPWLVQCFWSGFQVGNFLFQPLH